MEGFYVVEIPLDKDGNGPADSDQTISIVYEVWDQTFASQAQFMLRDDALRWALKLNEGFGG